MLVVQDERSGKNHLILSLDSLGWFLWRASNGEMSSHDYRVDLLAYKTQDDPAELWAGPGVFTLQLHNEVEAPVVLATQHQFLPSQSFAGFSALFWLEDFAHQLRADLWTR